MEEDVVTTQDIFVFEQEGIDKDGQGHRLLPGDRHPAEVRRPSRAGRHPPRPGDLRPHQAPGDAMMPLAIAALIFLLVVALIVGITWSLRGHPSSPPASRGGVVRGLGVEGDLLRVEAGRGARSGNRAGPPSAIGWRALPTRRAIPELAGTHRPLSSAAVRSSVLAGMDADGRAHLGDRGWPPSWAPLLLVFLAWRRQKRMQQFENQFPDCARRHGARHPSRKRPADRYPARRRRDARSHRGRVPPGVRGDEARDGSRRGAFTAVRAYADGGHRFLLHRHRDPARLGRQPGGDAGPAEPR